MKDHLPEQPKSLTKHDVAYGKIKKEYDEGMIWTLEEAGFVLINGVYQRPGLNLKEFTDLCLRWEVTPIHSPRSNVKISEEIARELPRLSSPEKIKQALAPGWSLLGIRLDSILSKPTPPYRNDQEFKSPWKNSPGMTTRIAQDEFLYLLILAHFEDDVKKFAQEANMDPLDWIELFNRNLRRIIEQKNPGLWDDSPANL